MQTNNQKAFTMVELIFVIVIIGILSAVALPKLSGTVHQAHLTKAKTVLASVRSSLSTERQKRILRGDITTNIGDLGDDTYAFQYFDNNSTLPILQYPVKNCSDDEAEACWERSDATTYKYYINSTEVAIFTLANNRLDCSVNSTTQCEKITE